MTHLWDTDTSVYYLNGNEKIARKMTECGLSNICVTSVTVAELIFGAYNSQRIEANKEI
jgi:tRNA(fMet)-specific endonuclease VapC